MDIYTGLVDNECDICIYITQVTKTGFKEVATQKIIEGTK